MRRIALIAALGIGLTTAVASAAPTKAERYKSAVKLENAGSVVDALAVFESIPPAERDFNARLHIASCKRKLGRMLEAAKDYAAIRDDKAADGPTRDTAASDLEAVVAATPRLRVTLAGKAIVEATVDGKLVEIPADVPLDPGPHEVIARHNGVIILERKVNLSESSKVDVVIDAPASASPHPSQAPVSAPSTKAVPASDAGDGRRTIGLVVGAVGVAALGVGTYAMFRVPGLVEERDQLAARGDMASFDRAADARSMQTIARLGLGVGVGAVATGAILILTAPAKRGPEVRVGVRGLGLTMEGTW